MLPSPPTLCFQMTFSRVGNIFGFCNILVVQPGHTQNASRIKLISLSACFLLAVTSGCFFFGNYNILQLLHLLPFLYSFSSIFMQMFKFLSHLVEAFSCLSSHFSSCNTLTVLLFYINSCSMCSQSVIAGQVKHASLRNEFSWRDPFWIQPGGLLSAVSDRTATW